MTQKVDIKPSQGTIVAIPFISSSSTFKSVKESSGDAQLSEVIAVGENYIDDHGTMRIAPCKVGDIIVNHYVQDTREIDFTEYRFIHFYEVRGVYKYATN
jgi:co-chaperonin GroES (HSP10)